MGRFTLFSITSLPDSITFVFTITKDKYNTIIPVQRNGGCSDLCLISPNNMNGTKYYCACPDDFILTDDKRTCIPIAAQHRCEGIDNKCDGFKQCRMAPDEAKSCPEQQQYNKDLP